MGNNLISLNVTIGSGASLSNAVDLSGLTVVGIQMPGAWTAANLTLQASSDGNTFADVYDSAGTELTITADASRFIPLAPAAMVAYPALKLRSGTAAAGVNQGADRDITLVARAIE